MEDNKKNYFIITETIVFLVIMLLLLRMYLEEKTLREYKRNWEIPPILDIFNQTEGENENDYFTINKTKFYIKRTKSKYNYPSMMISSNYDNYKICGKDDQGNNFYFPKYEKCPINNITLTSSCISKNNCIHISNEMYLEYSNENYRKPLITNVQYINNTLINDTYITVSESYQLINYSSIKYQRIQLFILLITYSLTFLILLSIIILKYSCDTKYKQFKIGYYIYFIYFFGIISICYYYNYELRNNIRDIEKALNVKNLYVNIVHFISRLIFYFSIIYLILFVIINLIFFFPWIFLLIKLIYSPYNSSIIDDIKLNYEMTPITKIVLQDYSSLENSYNNSDKPYLLGKIYRKDNLGNLTIWKGKSFYVERMNKNYKYPYLLKGKKKCGVDDNNSPLYIPSNEDCPINYITITKNKSCEIENCKTREINPNTYLHYSNESTDGRVLVHLRVSTNESPMADIKSYNELCTYLNYKNCILDNEYHGYENDYYGYSLLDIDKKFRFNLYSRTYVHLDKNSKYILKINLMKKLILLCIIFHIIWIILMINLIIYNIYKRKNNNINNNIVSKILLIIIDIIQLIIFICFLIQSIIGHKIKIAFTDNFHNYDIQSSFSNYYLFKFHKFCIFGYCIHFLGGVLLNFIFIFEKKEKTDDEEKRLTQNESNPTQREEDTISSNDNTLILRDNNEKYVSIEKMNEEIDILNKNQKQLNIDLEIIDDSDEIDEKETKLNKQLEKIKDINNNTEKHFNVIKDYLKLDEEIKNLNNLLQELKTNKKRKLEILNEDYNKLIKRKDELPLIDSEIKDQNEKIKQLNEEIKYFEKNDITTNNIEEYFDVIKEYVKLDEENKNLNNLLQELKTNKKRKLEILNEDYNELIKKTKTNELELINSKIEDQNEKINQLNKEIIYFEKRNNIEEYFDVIKEYLELDLKLKTMNEMISIKKNQIKIIKRVKTKKLELKELNNIIKKEDEDINKLKKIINNIKDNSQMYLKIIPEYIELKEKKEKYILLENLNIQIEDFKTKKKDLEKEYKLAEDNYNLEKEKVEKKNDLIQTFKDKNEDIKIDIQHYYDIIKSCVEKNQELKNLNNILSMLINH